MPMALRLVFETLPLKRSALEEQLERTETQILHRETKPDRCILGLRALPTYQCNFSLLLTVARHSQAAHVEVLHLISGVQL